MEDDSMILSNTVNPYDKGSSDSNHNNKMEEDNVSDLIINDTSISIEIEGIKSNNERNNIIKMLSSIENVNNVEISTDNSNIWVQANKNIDTQELLNLLKNSGYNCSLSNKNKNSFATEEKVELKIEGMSCSSCSNTIENYLSSITGVSKSSINYLFGTGDVWFDPNVVSKEKIRESIGDVGFEASIIPKNETNTLNVNIEGMTCSSCVNIIESYLKNVSGIISANVDLMTNSGVIVYNTDLIGIREVLSSIEDVGFEAKMLVESFQQMLI